MRIAKCDCVRPLADLRIADCEVRLCPPAGGCANCGLVFANCDQHDNFAVMEITLNNEPLTLEGDSVTVEKLLELKRYTFRLRIVKINGRLIDRDSYSQEVIHDGDTVQVIYLMSGG